MSTPASPDERRTRALERIADALERGIVFIPYEDRALLDEMSTYSPDEPDAPESAVDEQAHPEDPDAVQERPAGARHAVDPPQTPEVPRSGTVNDTSQKKACRASSEHIAGGNVCVLDQGHSGDHISFMHGQSYPWNADRLRG